MSKKYQKAVVIGRFQIPHDGHYSVFKEASQLADEVVILVGSVGKPSTPKNPFNFEERKEMIQSIIPDNISYKILPVRDQIYNTQNWIVDVANKVNSTTRGWQDKHPKTILVGHHKDASSYYLDVFKQWDYREVQSIKTINSTDIRNMLYQGKNPFTFDNISGDVKLILREWINSEKFSKNLEDYNYIKKYQREWGLGPHNTADALVIQSGHVLLVKRKHYGRGLWALPGGFLNESETLRQCAIRELIEETKIHLQADVLDSRITKIKTYDYPRRSERARIITQAHLIQLNDSKDLPRVYGSDDAYKAKWFPLNEVYTMGEQLFEDHLDIVLNITGDL